MSDPIIARTIEVENCETDCPCQSVHLVFLDADDEAFAAGSMNPGTARRLAADLIAKADIADAQKAKIERRMQ